MLSLFSGFFIFAVAFAAPYVSLPFNSQFPPPGRSGQTYSFKLSPDTFGPSSESAYFQLDLYNAPSWLSLNSSSRLLEGIPATNDTGSASFDIVASRGSDQVAMKCNLAIVDYDGPVIKGDLADVMTRGNELTGSTTVLIKPDSPVLVELANDTFGSAWNNLSFVATYESGLPLPGWLSFNSDSKTFFGQAPPLDSMSQFFNMRVIASDITGFASSELLFTFVLSDHKLAFSPISPTITLKKGETVDIENIGTMLQLDGEQIGTDQASALSAHGLPDWLHYDWKTAELKGDPPEDLDSLTFSVEALDVYHDYVNTTFTLTFVSSLFAEDVGTLEAPVGIPFSYTFQESFFATKGLNISLQTNNNTDWLLYDPLDTTIYGDVPSDAITGDIEVELLAISQEHGWTTENKTIRIHIAGPSPVNVELSKKRVILVVVLTTSLVVALLIIVKLAFVYARRLRAAERGQGLERVKSFDPYGFDKDGGNEPNGDYVYDSGHPDKVGEQQQALTKLLSPRLELAEALQAELEMNKSRQFGSATTMASFGSETRLVLAEAYGRFTGRNGIRICERSSDDSDEGMPIVDSTGSIAAPISRKSQRSTKSIGRRDTTSSRQNRPTSITQRSIKDEFSALQRKWTTLSRKSQTSSVLSTNLSDFPSPPLGSPVISFHNGSDNARFGQIGSSTQTRGESPDRQFRTVHIRNPTSKRGDPSYSEATLPESRKPEMGKILSEFPEGQAQRWRASLLKGSEYQNHPASHLFNETESDTSSIRPRAFTFVQTTTSDSPNKNTHNEIETTGIRFVDSDSEPASPDLALAQNHLLSDPDPSTRKLKHLRTASSLPNMDQSATPQITFHPSEPPSDPSSQSLSLPRSQKRSNTALNVLSCLSPNPPKQKSKKAASASTLKPPARPATAVSRDKRDQPSLPFIMHPVESAPSTASTQLKNNFPIPKLQITPVSSGPMLIDEDTAADITALPSAASTNNEREREPMHEARFTIVSPLSSRLDGPWQPLPILSGSPDRELSELDGGDNKGEYGIVFRLNVTPPVPASPLEEPEIRRMALIGEGLKVGKVSESALRKLGKRGA